MRTIKLSLDRLFENLGTMGEIDRDFYCTAGFYDDGFCRGFEWEGAVYVFIDGEWQIRATVHYGSPCVCASTPFGKPDKD